MIHTLHHARVHPSALCRAQADPSTNDADEGVAAAPAGSTTRRAASDAYVSQGLDGLGGTSDAGNQRPQRHRPPPQVSGRDVALSRSAWLCHCMVESLHGEQASRQCGPHAGNFVVRPPCLCPKLPNTPHTQTIDLHPAPPTRRNPQHHSLRALGAQPGVVHDRRASLDAILRHDAAQLRVTQPQTTPCSPMTTTSRTASMLSAATAQWTPHISA